MKSMPVLAQKIISGLIAGWFAAVAFGFVIGVFTMFMGSIPGAMIGYYVGFRWGYKRVGVAAADGSGAMPITVGDTAFLAAGFFGFLWLAIALPDLLFGYSAPYKGHILGIFFQFWDSCFHLSLHSPCKLKRAAVWIRHCAMSLASRSFLFCWVPLRCGGTGPKRATQSTLNGTRSGFCSGVARGGL